MRTTMQRWRRTGGGRGRHVDGTRQGGEVGGSLLHSESSGSVLDGDGSRMRDDGAGVRDDDIYGVLQGGGGGRGGRALARNPCGGALSTVARTTSTVTSQCSMEARVVHDDRRIERADGGGRRSMVAAAARAPLPDIAMAEEAGQTRWSGRHREEWCTTSVVWWQEGPASDSCRKMALSPVSVSLST